MKLYLMRHGEAAADTPAAEPVLTPTGRADIESLAERLGRQDLRISHILHSNKARARQTAAIIAAAIAPNVDLQVHDKIRPSDDPMSIYAECLQWREGTLIVSHLPFIPALLALLTETTGNNIGFEPGTIICLSRQTRGWQIEWTTAP
jgi:phosphohistidine phosphatase